MDALKQYAAVKNPGKQLSSSLRLAHTDATLTIFDAFPKARYHFLCLPRLPFPTQGDAPCKVSDLDRLSTLLRLPRSVAQLVVIALEQAAEEAKEMIEDEMMKTEGFIWDVYAGFHAVPSMRHLHLHVFSSDMTSERLKNKHHYNSFRPDLNFFIHLKDVKDWLSDDVGESFAHNQALGLEGRSTALKQPLSCFKCGRPCATMPDLKRHLLDEWEKEKRSQGLQA